MKLVPATDLARRVGALCKRRPGTPWDPKEIRVYKRLVKAGFYKDPDDLLLVEQYYAFQRKKGDNGFHRRKLYTYLNNAAGELDAARDWRERHPLKPAIRTIIPMPLLPSEPPKPLTPEEQQRTEAFCLEMLRRDPDNKTWQKQVSAFRQQKQVLN